MIRASPRNVWMVGERVSRGDVLPFYLIRTWQTIVSFPTKLKIAKRVFSLSESEQ